MSPSSQHPAKAMARLLLRIRERFFPRTQFSNLPLVGRLIPMLMRRARSTVVENVHGHRMFVDEKDSMGLSIDPMFEPLETRFCAAAVGPGLVVVDVGANIGYYTLLFAKHVGPSGKVFAFEPDPDNFGLLTKNIETNGYSNVVPLQAAVSDAAGQLDLYRNDANRMDHRTYSPGEGWQSVSVPAIRLDDYFAPSSRRVDVIKMDIQGSEPKALAGMAALLADNRDVIFITEFWPYGLRAAGHDPAAYLADLGRLGFQLSEIDERRGRLSPTTAAQLLSTLDDRDKWAATNLVCARAPLPDFPGAAPRGALR